MRKKRICLIGTEQPGADGQEVISAQRLTEIEAWAVANGFDGVAVVSARDGLSMGACADAHGAGQRMSSMGRRQRNAWAVDVAAQVARRWQSTGAIGEIVLLGGLVGYQELADELRKIHGGLVVTAPLGGASMVRSAAGAGEGAV
jgi:hypothetical protein